MIQAFKRWAKARDADRLQAMRERLGDLPDAVSRAKAGALAQYEAQIRQIEHTQAITAEMLRYEIAEAEITLGCHITLTPWLG